MPVRSQYGRQDELLTCEVHILFGDIVVEGQIEKKDLNQAAEEPAQ